MAATCAGLTEDHCCYLGRHGVCPYLEEGTIPGRRWACGLRRELGSWDAVHADDRYLTTVRPCWDEVGMVDCGDWPPPEVPCGTCGVMSDG